nr:hypothetical protein [Bacteroidota bacterium]
MKHLAFFVSFLLISFGCHAQTWYAMGEIDTVGNTNSERAVGEITCYNNMITIGGYFKKTSTKQLNSIAQW